RTMGPRRVSHPAWHRENAHENDNELRTRKAEAYRKAHRLQMPSAPKIRPGDRSTIRVQTWPAIRAARSSFAYVEFPENLAVLQWISCAINSRRYSRKELIANRWRRCAPTVRAPNRPWCREGA